MNSLYERIDLYRNYKSCIPGLEDKDSIPTFYMYLYSIFYIFIAFGSLFIIVYQAINIATNNFILESKLLQTGGLLLYLLGIPWLASLITNFHYKKLNTLEKIESTIFNNDHLSKLLVLYKKFYFTFLYLSFFDFLFKIIYKYSNAGIVSYQVGIGVFLVQIILLVFYITIIYILYQIYQDQKRVEKIFENYGIKK